MNWLMWRQRRKQIIFALVVLVAFVTLLITTEPGISNTYHQALLTCSQTNTCNSLQDALFQDNHILFSIVPVVALVVPLLLGLFWGAPLIAKEYEEGTDKLVWTQSVTRRRWLMGKLVWTILIAAVYGAIIAALVSWWSTTGNALYLYRFGPTEFDAQGIMPAVYAIFATALGIALGAWLKKVMLAVAVTLGIFVFTQGTVALLIRPHYMTPVTHISALGDQSMPASGSLLYVKQDNVDSNGHPATIFQVPDTCKAVQGKLAQTNDILPCLAAHGYHRRIVYQPANRLWSFQLIEASGYLTISFGLILAAYWLVLKRDA